MNTINRKWMTRIARMLLLAAAAVAAYLGLASSGAALAGCGDSSSCSDLLASKWSQAFGVPVAFLGMAAYLLLAALAGVVSARSRGPLAKPAAVLMVVIPAIAVWFLVVQLFIVKAICPWCCLAHALAVLGVSVLFFARLSNSAGKIFERGRGTASAVVPSASLLIVVGFIAASGLGKDRPAGVAESKLGSPLRHAQLTADGHVGKAIELDGGKVSVWPEELPGFGNPKADKVAVLITDFTCEHCRALHAILDKVTQLYGDQLGVVILPATRGDESILIQRVALALHRENPDLYRALASSLGSGELPANASAVADEATRLMGAERLSSAMQKHRGWIDAQLATTRALRDANARETGRRTLPQLVIGDEVVFGAHPSPGYYVDLLHSKFALLQVAVVEEAIGPGSADDRPVLELKSRRLRLGKVQPGQVLNVSLPYENTGEGPLVFSWIKTQPGVEFTGLPSGEIEPGTKGELAFNVRVPDEIGTLQRSFVIHSNAHLEGLAVNISALVTAGEIQQVNAGDGEPE